MVQSPEDRGTCATSRPRVAAPAFRQNAASVLQEHGHTTVVVIRYVEPRGGPGMPEMYAPMKYLAAHGLAASAAVVTDGRFSGTNNGCFVGHVCPEAAHGGPVELVRDGNEIAIDVPAGALRLHVSERELERRRAAWRPPVAKQAPEGLLALYAQLAGPAARGAVTQLTET